VLAVSKPLNQSCWIRIAGVMEYVQPDMVMRALWENVLPELKAQAVHTVGLLVINEWITQVVLPLGFAYKENIITMVRSEYRLPEPRPTEFRIRAGELYDLPRLVEIDQAAFSPPWQMAADDVRQAYRMASSCTVATLSDEIIGYQISTLYFDGAHLARLAVHPAAQGKAVGRVILGELLDRFQKRGVYMVTVNTQSSNLHSRNLYTHFGFIPNGFDLPYWSAQL
jgi:[ribosomal protein S18]-alanine N-acetyltransferase